MRLENTPQETTVLRLEQRKSFSFAVRFKDGRGAPIDLTGATLTLDWLINLVRLENLDTMTPEDIATSVATLVDPKHGYARFDVQASELKLRPDSYPFTITLRTAGYSVVVLKGTIELQLNPEFASQAEEYAGTQPGQDLEVRLQGLNLVAVTVGSMLPPGVQYLTDGDKEKLDLLQLEAGGVVIDLRSYATVTAVDAAVTRLDASLVEAADERAALLARIAAIEAAAAADTAPRAAPGMITMMAGTVTPEGWLLCNGQLVSRTTYARLFSTIGVSYGAGNGTTTFALPDLRGRVPTGQDASQSEFSTIGKVGGAKTHTLAVTEMPSHTHLQNAHSHSITDPGHGHANPVAVTYGGNAAGERSIFATNSAFWSKADWNNGSALNTTGVTNVATTAVNQATGGGAAHNNLAPYHTLNFYIAS